MFCLAIGSAEAWSAGLGAVRASVRKTYAWARMSSVGGIAAEHANSGAEFRAAQGHHMLAVYRLSTRIHIQLDLMSAHRICEATISR